MASRVIPSSSNRCWRSAIGEGSAVPPFANLAVGIAVVIDDYERAAIAHPLGQRLVEFKRRWLLPLVRQQQQRVWAQVAGRVGILYLHRFHRQSALQ